VLRRGAKQHTGSFGWAVATATKILWECSGRATGWFANSFRSEGIGQLALLAFLEAFANYFQLLDLPLNHCSSSDPWIRIATDNQGLIQRITAELDTPTVFAGAGLNAECDVVHKILEITRRLPFPLVWERVKGHQDDVRQWCELTRMETLNVRADAHATALQNGMTQIGPAICVTCLYHLVFLFGCLLEKQQRFMSRR
jgi:hypothetical protein